MDKITSFIKSFMNNSSNTANATRDSMDQLLIDAYDRDYDEMKRMQSKMKNMVTFNLNDSRKNLVPNQLPPLPKSKYNMEITELVQLSVDQLEFKRNEGGYFKGKIIRKPWKMAGPSSAIHVLMEDKFGHIARGNFYNVIDSDDWNKIGNIFQVGREVCILHPFYKQAADGLLLIRVENKYEFFLGDEMPRTDFNFDELYAKTMSLKDQGNQRIKNDLDGALISYTNSLTTMLKQKPALVDEKEEFLLEWKVLMNGSQKNEALEHLSVIFSNCSHVFTRKKQPLMALAEEFR